MKNTSYQFLKVVLNEMEENPDYDNVNTSENSTY